MKIKIFSAFATAVFLLSFLASASFANEADKIVEARQDNFQSIKKTMKALGKSLKNPDRSLALAMELQTYSAKVVELFPKSSMNPAIESDALPVIWKKFDDFKSKAEALNGSSAKLVAALKKGDTVEAIDIMDDIKADCKACHKAFRN